MPSGAVGRTVDCTPAMYVDSLFCGSVGGVWMSQRNPRFSVKRGWTRKSSWTNTAVYQVLVKPKLGASWVSEFGIPSSKSASAFLVDPPLNPNTP